MDSLNVLDTVVVLIDIPSEKLKKGSLGTIVESFNNENFLVEFADFNGITYALLVLSINQLMKVYQEPIEA